MAANQKNIILSCLFFKLKELSGIEILHFPWNLQQKVANNVESLSFGS